MNHPIVQAKNGVTVYINLIGSRASASIAQHPYLLGLVKEVLQQTRITDSTLYFDHDMGRPIGSANVVETSEKDTILYAQALHDDRYKRFVKNGQPLPTQHISLMLERDADGGYELLDTWVGPLRPPHPASDDATAASREYWDTHAFVLDLEPIKLRTLTKTCPY